MVLEATRVRLERAPKEAVWRIEAILGLSRRELAFILDTDQRSVERWAIGETYPQREARNGLAELEQLSDDLWEVFEDKEPIREWLTTPSPYLADTAPLDMLRARRVDKAAGALEALRSGIFI
jgi:hypothetical protein